MDIVIPLGLGSRWNNNELRYALRSAEMYLKDIGDVYILGKAPSWSHNLIQVEIPDIGEYPATNIFHKVHEFCKIRSTSFLFMNDDHYLNPIFDPAKYYRQGKLYNVKSDNVLYRNVIHNTMKLLGADVRYYDVHTPIVYDPKKFIERVACYDWSVPWGYLIKSLYCDLLVDALENAMEIEDGKINDPKTINELFSFDIYKVCLSSGNEINEVFKQYLKQTYPNKSKYES